MSQTAQLQFLAEHLKETYRCHSVILYGSRARGDWTESSDIDIVGISDSAERVIRHVTKPEDGYVDGFIYPTRELESPNASHLYMRDGRVLIDTRGFGATFLRALASIHESGPHSPADEVAMKRVWTEKMLERASRGDAEGEYRKHWLIYALLEDYFLYRGLWYEGAKKAFAYLKANDHAVLQGFEAVFADPKDLARLRNLAALIVR